MMDSIFTKTNNVDGLIAETIDSYKKGKLSKTQTRILLGILMNKKAVGFLSNSVRNLIESNYNYKKGFKYV